MRKAVSVESYKNAIRLETVLIVLMECDEDRENVSTLLEDSGERQLL